MVLFGFTAMIWYTVSTGIAGAVTLAVWLIALIVILGLHAGSLGSPGDLRMTRGLLTGLIMAEIIIIVLVAINLSATAVSREREEGF